MLDWVEQNLADQPPCSASRKCCDE